MSHKKNNDYYKFVKKDPDYYKFKPFETPYYLLYKSVIYETYKHNEAKHIIKNINTNELFIMSWDLYTTLNNFKTLDQAKEYSNKYNNYFNISQLQLYYNNDDIYNYNYDETLILYTPKQKQPKIKHLEYNNILIC